MVYCTFSYFIICDTDDPKEFHIECTSMKDYRLRFSAMKSKHRKSFGDNPPVSFHCNAPKKKSVPKVSQILMSNWCYYLLERKEFDTPEAAFSYRDILTKDYVMKMNTLSCTERDYLRVQFA
jgi:hypothetical protein